MSYQDLVPFSMSLLLKEINFDEPCWFIFRDIHDDSKEQVPMLWNNAPNESYKNSFNTYTASAPTWSQIFSWFRRNGLGSSIIEDVGGCSYTIYFNKEEIISFRDYTNQLSYEEIQLNCLRTLIDVYKKNKMELSNIDENQDDELTYNMK